MSQTLISVERHDKTPVTIDAIHVIWMSPSTDKAGTTIHCVDGTAVDVKDEYDDLKEKWEKLKRKLSR